MTGWCGDLSRPGGCRVGLCRHGFLWGRGGSAGRARFRCAGTGVHTLWCPLWQQWRTPLCLRVHLGHGGKLCSGHSCSWGLRATCSSAWWPSLQQSSAVRRSRLHVIHAKAECAVHCVWPDSVCVCVCVCAFRGGQGHPILTVMMFGFQRARHCHQGLRLWAVSGRFLSALYVASANQHQMSST